MTESPRGLQIVLDRLQAEGCNPRPSGSGYTARCPAHDDRKASLSVSEGDCQPVLLYCHAGCTLDDILARLGLTRSNVTLRRKTPDRKPPDPSVTACYDYTDETGNLVFQVVRREPKRFSQRRPDGDGHWMWGLRKGRYVQGANGDWYPLKRNGQPDGRPTKELGECPRFLYRLPAVLETVRNGGTVYVVEGEKDADAINSHDPDASGYVATTNPGGAGKWRPEYTEALRNARVVIVADKDGPGQKHARQLAEKLAGIAGSVEIVEAREGKDAYDHLQAGHRLEDFVPLEEAEPHSAQVEAVSDVEKHLGRPELVDGSGEPDYEVAESLLRQLAASMNGADSLRRITVREQAKRLLEDRGFRSAARLVDAALRCAEGDTSKKQGQALDFSDPEPWPEPQRGAQLLNELAQVLSRFLALPSGAADAMALWVVHAHAPEASSVSPLLVFTSPEKRCGKTTALELISAIVPRPLPASNITSAALFRSVEKYRPTLLIDEAETFLKDNEELRGVVNSGHTKTSAWVVRTAGDKHEPQRFSTWCPKAIALIGRLSGTLEDRSIIVAMHRRSAGEKVERLRRDRFQEDLRPLLRKVARWAADDLTTLQGMDPDVPQELHDRAQDNWRPLLAIADVAGAEWPERARRAALLLTDGETEGSPRIQLLHDLRDLFDRDGVDRMASKDVVNALGEMEDRPWPEWRNSKPITTRQLAKLLKGFDVSPKTIWIEGQSAKGYLLESFEDTFARYLPADPSGPSGSSDDAENRLSANRQEAANLTDGELPRKQPNPGNLTDLTDGEPASPGDEALTPPCRPGP